MPGLDQIWYLDDGFLHGPPSVVASALLQLQNMLPDLHLLVNTAKCELYAQAGTVLPDSLILLRYHSCLLVQLR